MANSFRLTMQRGPNVGKTFELVKDVVTMGRDMSNDIVINDAESSRHHARLSKQGDSYVIEDLGSTNGTFVNSARVSSPRALNNGDVVGVGETVTLHYEVAVAAPEIGGATVIGGVDATVVASGDMSAKQIQEMAAASAPPPMPEPPTAPMPQAFDLPPAQPAMSAPDPSPLSSKPAGGDSKRNMYIGIGVGAFVLLCCCCPALIAGFYYLFTSGLFGG